MNVLPKTLDNAIEALRCLPGVGQRSAERFAYYLFCSDNTNSEKIISALNNLHSGIAICPITFALMDSGDKISPLYTRENRNKKVIAVVEDSFDIMAIEKTNNFNGTYHVLGGLLSPIDGIGPDKLHINELIKRIEKDEANEVILAISSSVEGESTAHYIIDQLGKLGCDITRLARGLPIGLDLEYADQVTLGRAFEGRQKI